MENRTKFNLRENIEIWKSELSKKSNMTLDNISELESHLLDEIDQLKQQGLNPEESLLIAKKRIGNVTDLDVEFGKVNRHFHFRNKIIPYLKGALLFIAFIIVTELFINVSLLLVKKIGVFSENLNFVTIGLLIFFTIAMSIFFYRKYRKGNFKIRILNIPFLASIIVIGKFLYYGTLLLLVREATPHDFGILNISLTIYQLLFGTFIIITTCLLFYFSNRDKKTKNVE